MSWLDDFWKRKEEDHRHRKLMEFRGVPQEAYWELGERYKAEFYAKRKAEDKMAQCIRIATDIASKYNDKEAMERIYETKSKKNSLLTWWK